MTRPGPAIVLVIVACGGGAPNATDMAATSSGDGTSSSSSTAPTSSDGPGISSEGSSGAPETAATSTPAGPVCGDGVVDDGEQCDDGKDGDDDDECTDLCTLPRCGDDLVQASLGEQCDEGPGNADEGTCTAACKLAVCGDGLVNVHEYQEECDDGNTVNDDECSNGCARFCCSPILATYGTNWVSFAGGTWHTPPGSHPQYVSPGIAVARDGRGLLVYVLSEGQVQAVLFKDGVWRWEASPSDLTGSQAEPAVSVHDQGFHVVYEGDDMHAYYAGFDGELWEPHAEPLAVDSVGLGAVVTLAGDAAYVYHDAAQGGALMLTMRSPTWQPPELISSETQSSRPAVVALTAGPELMVVDGDRSFTRTLGMWSPPTSFTDAEMEPGSVSLVALPDGGAAVAWTNGSDDVLVAFHAMNADQWSPPEAVLNAEFPAKIAAGLGPATLELVTASKHTFRHARRIDGVWEINTQDSNVGNGPGLVSLGSATP